MRRTLFLKAVVFAALTALTQIGGVVYAVVSLACSAPGRHHIPLALRPFIVPVAGIVLYAVMTAFVVPPLAAHWGRERLPCTQADPLVPATILTCALNRGYVRTQTLVVLRQLANDLSQRFPGSRLGVLEGGFPFFDGFPLMPHLSHRDGRKVDLSFFYLDKNGNPRPDRSPSFWAISSMNSQTQANPNPAGISTAPFVGISTGCKHQTPIGAWM